MHGKAALKRLRELLSSGLRLGVDMPRVAALRSHIQAREWREAASKVCPECATLTPAHNATSAVNAGLLAA